MEAKRDSRFRGLPLAARRGPGRRGISRRPPRRAAAGAVGGLGLLMMGPDCGTAVINGVGLGFANKLRRGNIGLAAASGTGLQEVMTLISNFGGGISQALGTGGRDLKEDPISAGTAFMKLGSVQSIC